MRVLTAVLIATLLVACGRPPISRDVPAIAPDETVAGEVWAEEDNSVFVPAGESAVYRVQTMAGEHVGFRFEFPVGATGVTLSVMRWDGAHPVEIGETDDGAGLRVLAVVDQSGPRTFWVRIDTPVDAVTGALTVTRTPFVDGTQCLRDCDDLLQLPLPNDPVRDGYDVSEAIARYEFGRRDLVMLVRAAGRRMADAGYPPIRPWDLSDWQGRTPGIDVGEPRHASHQRGRDVDVALYGVLGQAPWTSYCATHPVKGGHECVPGSHVAIFDAERNARLIGAFFVSRRVTMLLDRELIAALAPGVEEAVAAGAVQHWPNHENHLHVRVSEGVR